MLTTTPALCKHCCVTGLLVRLDQVLQWMKPLLITSHKYYSLSLPAAKLAVHHSPVTVQLWQCFVLRDDNMMMMVLMT